MTHNNKNQISNYKLKFLLVGDSDVGKEEILNQLSGSFQSCPPGIQSKISDLDIDGIHIKIQLWSASGQGRFSTIIRSFSHGVHAVLIVYDITNKISFKSIKHWLKEIDKNIPGIPKLLIGNRLHLEFKREVKWQEGEQYATLHSMQLIELSSLSPFNIVHALLLISNIVLRRMSINGAPFNNNNVQSLQELACDKLIQVIPFSLVNTLQLPSTLLAHLKNKYVIAYSINHQKKSLSINQEKIKLDYYSSSSQTPKSPLSTASHRSPALIFSPRKYVINSSSNFLKLLSCVYAGRKQKEEDL